MIRLDRALVSNEKIAIDNTTRQQTYGENSLANVSIAENYRQACKADALSIQDREGSVILSCKHKSLCMFVIQMTGFW